MFFHWNPVDSQSPLKQRLKWQCNSPKNCKRCRHNNHPRIRPSATKRAPLISNISIFFSVAKLNAMSDTLVVNEIYLSLQGESTFAGLPCIFIRLTACDLRCSYCDTAYAFTEGKKKSLAEILAEVTYFAEPFSNSKFKNHNPKLPLIELTGGHPMLQKNSHPLMKQ